VNTIVTQALACGLPVVTTRHSGLPEQVLDGLNGFVVEEGDWQALGDRLVYLSEHTELLPAMSEAGLRHVKSHYDAAILIEQQIEAYRELAGRAALRRRHSG
jgi:colanic acid/amylovoran biosynthesis glycosyltransferase